MILVPLVSVSVMRLLLVEDDVKLVRALQRGLEREGYGVDIAYDGDEALVRAAAQRTTTPSCSI